SNHHVSDLTHSRNTVDGSRLFCYRHKTENVEFYCKDCCQIICKKCQISDHKDHDTSDIKLYRKLAMTELKNYVDNVNEKIFYMNASAVTSSKKIDQQVQAICETVTTKGRKFKLHMQRELQKEEFKMKRVVESSKKIIDKLEESVHNINTILKGDSMYGVLDRLPTLKSKQEENEARELNELYDVTSEFDRKIINTTSTINTMMGELKITRNVMITYYFKYSEIKHNWRYSPVYKVEDTLWHFKAFETGSGHLILGMIAYGENLVSDTPEVTIKLVNSTDEQKSVVKVMRRPCLATLKADYTWNTGCEKGRMSSAGFVNNDRFSLQATIAAKDILSQKFTERHGKRIT
ncbi:uncharacterized protein LOC126830434, partial [Patella vulgata]|uniref:uncharacterized protein LOC126830434 n=1 Tax=Patella vulgata TaxID=6465 RepID=UPI00217F6E72